MQILRDRKILTFSQWVKVREDFHQGTGANGAEMPLKTKPKRRVLQAAPLFNLDRGQGYQATKRDDGNG